MKCSISPGDVHDHPTHRHLSPDSTSRRLFFGDFSHNGSPLFSLKEYIITITLRSRKMSMSEISWFVDITTLNFRPDRGIESGAHWPLFFTFIKEDSDTQVRSNCSVAEVIHNLLFLKNLSLICQNSAAICSLCPSRKVDTNDYRKIIWECKYNFKLF